MHGHVDKRQGAFMAGRPSKLFFSVDQLIIGTVIEAS